MNFKILVTSLLFTLFVQTGQGQGVKFIHTTLDEALEEAMIQNKNLFIDTYSSWCAPCKRMNKHFRKKEVGDFYNEHFVNLKVNMENPTQANSLKKKYDVVFLPTIYILDPYGKIKYRGDQELNVEQLLRIGQTALDPNSYYVTEGSRIRRNNSASTAAEQAKWNKSPAPVQKPIEEKREKETDVATNESPTGSSTVETVEESTDNILYVMDGKDGVPAEFLREEAYFKLTLMDGSHRSSAKAYLDAQQTWADSSTMQFILDFMEKVDSREYDYLIMNKPLFIQTFGKQRVQEALRGVIYKKLHSGIPRPTFEETMQLYSDLEVSNPTKSTQKYFMNRLLAEDKMDEALSMAETYFDDLGREDHKSMYQFANQLSTSNKEYNDLDAVLPLEYAEKAIQLHKSNPEYFTLAAKLHMEQGNLKKAKNYLTTAIKIKKKLNIDTEELEKTLSDL